MYLTSLAHRQELFNVAERWLCNRLEPTDGQRLTQILICDGFILGETLGAFIRLLLSEIHGVSYRSNRIRFKGELREFFCTNGHTVTPRVEELLRQYRENPDFFYVEAPINGTVCVDETGRLLGIHRIKRPRRIAEKANRYIANWIFRLVQSKATQMAEERAEKLGIPLEYLTTPEDEMAREFTLAEESIARTFKEGTVRLDRSALTVNDVGGIKVVADEESLVRLEAFLEGHPAVNVVEQEKHEGSYRARSMIVDVPWDSEEVCRSYTDSRAWERYRGRGVPDNELQRGIESFIKNPEPKIRFELMLSTFPDLVESELGISIHEERIVEQRGQKIYRGYIPMNVEFLIEYLLAVGLSPQTQVERLPVKLWGRYLPDTISYHIRQLYRLPEYDTLY